MFVIEFCQKIEYNALFMMIFIQVSNFGDQPVGFLRIAKISKRNRKKDVHKEIVIIAIEQYTKNLCHLCKM